MPRIIVCGYCILAATLVWLVGSAGHDVRRINAVAAMELAVQASFLAEDIAGYSYAVQNNATDDKLAAAKARYRRRLSEFQTSLQTNAVDFDGRANVTEKLTELVADIEVLDNYAPDRARPDTSTTIAIVVRDVRVSGATLVGTAHAAVEELIARQNTALRSYIDWVIALSISVALTGGVFLLLCRKMVVTNDALERVATEDALTGLPNRRMAHARGDALTKQACRDGYAISVAVIDIDYFKSINDTFGHPAGDATLAIIGEILRSETRGSDVSARVGGEEFMLILPDTDEKAALVVCERVRMAIAGHLAVDHGLEIRVTASVGVATGAGRMMAFEELYHRADQALYAAKTAGRNRVASSRRQTGVVA